MRWFIEVSSGNPTGPAEQWVVEAPQWQPALQAARTMRGEPFDTTGFSIELLEDGFRVVDPATLVRYVVRRAPDGTPLSTHAPSESAAPALASTDGASTEASTAPEAAKLAPAPAAVNGENAVAAAPNSASAAPVRKSEAPPAHTSSAAPRVGATAPPNAGAPAADLSGMTQAERIAAMLSVDATPRASSRAPRSPSAAPKSSAPKTAPRSVPAPSTRNGGQASHPPAPPEAAPSSASGAVLRAPQGAALRAPRAAAVAIPDPPRPLSNPPPSAVAEPSAAEAPAVEPVVPVQVVPAVPAVPEASALAAQPPPRMITQPPAVPVVDAPVVQSLSELQALVLPHAPPRPVSQPPPPPAVHAAQPAVVAQASQPLAAEVPVPSSELPMPSSPPDSLPLPELLFQRSEDPSASSPLTYREAAWAVPEGTSIAAAVRLLAGMFEGVRAALAGVKPGKLVYMAIFDHRFVGKPTRPPLATLTWKDWKDQGQGPEIRRQGEPRTSFQPPPMTSSFIPAAVPQPPASAPPAAHAPIASVVAAPTAAPAPIVAPAAPGVPSISIAPEGAPPPYAAPAVLSPAETAAAPAVADAPAPFVQVPAQEVPQAAPMQGVMAPPVAVVPAPKLVIVPEPVTPLPVAAPAPPTPAPSTPAVRLSGVELIADLFECMHDLHFLPDALAGADFVLHLMLDKLPSAVVLVHFYDIDAREFVVVRAVGTGAAKVMQVRTSEKEPLIAEAMHKRRAVVLDDATADPRAQNGRWALIGEPPRSLVCAPVEEGGRFLGLLELSNPLDGQPFHEGDGHAITYIGEQFAEFLAARGIVLDPERIGV
jgi:hypothetical protein